MKNSFLTIFLFLFIFGSGFSSETFSSEIDTGPIKVLMITGGGWHDYEVQKELLSEGLTERIGNIEFTIDMEGGDRSEFRFSRHENDEWARDYDLVLYNNCQTEVDGADWVERIVEAHVEHQTPAVMLHCAAHSFREDTNVWFEFVGARSHRHERHQPFTVEAVETSHPVMANFPGTWRTPHGELYEIVELMQDAIPLARAYGIDTNRYHDVAWVHKYKGVRVFSSTLGHHNETMGHDVNLNLVASGLLWAVGKLNDDGTAAEGYKGNRGLGWISIWDGETLNGWRASEYRESFQVEDGKIVVDGPRSHLFYEGSVAGGDFINFEMKSEVYTYPNANSGIFFHTRFQDNGWPRHGYEAQINATHSDRRKTGSLYAVNDVMDDAPHRDNEWFEYYIKVDGKNILFKVNDETVMEFTEPDDREGTIRLNRGTLSLQAHDPESRIYFQNLQIRLWP